MHQSQAQTNKNNYRLVIKGICTTETNNKDRTSSTRFWILENVLIHVGIDIVIIWYKICDSRRYARYLDGSYLYSVINNTFYNFVEGENINHVIWK